MGILDFFDRCTQFALSGIENQFQIILRRGDDWYIVLGKEQGTWTCIIGRTVFFVLYCKRKLTH